MTSDITTCIPNKFTLVIRNTIVYLTMILDAEEINTGSIPLCAWSRLIMPVLLLSKRILSKLSTGIVLGLGLCFLGMRFSSEDDENLSTLTLVHRLRESK